MTKPVYLDYNATTPIDPQVADAIIPFLREHFGNPSSAHLYGRRAREAVEQARGEVARLVGAAAEEMVFTGCATEANNLAIQGVARALRGTKRHLVTSAIEHPSVIQPFLRLQEDGWDLTILPVDRNGRVDPADVARALRADTALVSVMHANNETGTVQSIAEIAAMARSRGVLVHTDAAQSIGKIPVDVSALGVDLLTLAGHKFYAPKGVGALYVRRETPIASVLVGAEQERGLRPGTENVPAIVGLGKAAELARQRLPEAQQRLQQLRDLLHGLLLKQIPGLALNGHLTGRLPNTLNASFPDVDGRVLLQHASERVAASVGAACHGDGYTVSGVLAAMGVPPEQARGAVRLSVGLPTNDDDVQQAAQALIAAWGQLKQS
jgi:cysteine desulfurase